ncbi:MAG: TrkH family potassium uptake protein [Methyloligellaceae bacterium]
MIDHRPILLVIGILLATLGCAMMIPALLEVALEQDGWVVFAASSVLTLFFGIAMAIASRGKTGNLSLREAFLLTTFSWVFLAAFGAIPFAWSNLGLSYTDAFFESMSGLTTTGATVIVGLDTAPRGLILWRALLQWLGGIGIIVMAIAVLPMLQIGGMQLFKVEAFDAPEKILPRATQISGSLSSIYLIFTVACAFGYFIAGMNYFDAIVHSMTTIATGGYSSYDSSFQKFNDAGIESVAIVGMILGSIPFLLYLKGFRLGPLELFKDEQVRGFLIALGFFILLLAIQQTLTSKFGFFTNLRHSAFNVTSLMTGTGYVSTDYNKWGNFAIGLVFLVMFVGGCSGSTSCGIKIFRFQVMYSALQHRIKTLIYPSGMFAINYNGHTVSQQVISSVMSFFFLFVLFFLLLSLSLEMLGLDSLTAMSASASALANVGPGLGELVGPNGNFSKLPDAAKWLLSFGMLLGRLELFAVLVLFTPSFWRR